MLFSRVFAAACCLFLVPTLNAQERTVVSLKDLVSAELRAGGFTLPRPMKVHVYAKGAESLPTAYGWILRSDTREVVWSLEGRQTRAEGPYRVADQYFELPAGSYEAYFANPTFSRNSWMTQWQLNIDRRKSPAPAADRGFWQGIAASFQRSQLREWRREAGNYGLEVYIPGPDSAAVQTFAAPLQWRNPVVQLRADADNRQWSRAFRLKKPTTLHLYAEGELSGGQMVDGAWIQELHSRKRVWEMTAEKSQYAGGAAKNRRQVETLRLPAGDYLAVCATDDSHSPADWNAAPPCDPLLYGLCLSVPADGELANVQALEPQESQPLAALVKVGNGQRRTQAFELKADQELRVYALGEAGDKELADFAWIEDARGRRVWEMALDRTRPAGGALKNRVIDELVRLPKGAYTLGFETDDSHAYGHWNAAPPRDAEHYGVSLYPAP